MKKIKCKIALLLAIVVLVSNASMAVVGATQESENQKKVEKYVKLVEKELQRLYDYGQIVYLAKTTNKVDQEIPKTIYKYIEEVDKLSSELSEFVNTLRYQSIERLDASGLFIAVEYIRLAYEALLTYYYAADTKEAYDALAVYYYYLSNAGTSSKLIAQ